MECISAKGAPSWNDQAKPDNQRDFAVQSIISVAVGFIALLAFCVSARQFGGCASLTDFPHRYFDPDGPPFMLRARNRRMQRPFCQSYPTPSLGGYPRCTASQRTRFWPRRVWMPMSFYASSGWLSNSRPSHSSYRWSSCFQCTTCILETLVCPIPEQQGIPRATRRHVQTSTAQTPSRQSTILQRRMDRWKMTAKLLHPKPCFGST